MDFYVYGASLGRLPGDALRGHFQYRFVCVRGLPGPPARRRPPEAIFSIDLYAYGASLGRLPGNALRRPLSV